MIPVIVFKRSVKQNKGLRFSLGTTATHISFSTRMTLREYFKACNRAGVTRYA